jgi:3-keto-5-aminohexanoate cleavage enzyme
MVDDLHAHAAEDNRLAFGVVDACVITCAMSGIAANRDQCPAIPYAPEDYAKEARRAYDAGASVLHIHARYPDGKPSFRVEEYRAITQAILAEVPEVVVNFSTGAVGIPIEERVHQIVALRPELGALNMGSMNYAKYSAKRKALVFDFVFANPFQDIIYLLEKMNAAGVKPECECFDTGHIGNVGPLIDMGLLVTPIQFSLILGVLGGAPADPRTLAHMASLLPRPSTWEVIGIGRAQWSLVAGAISLDGHVRVGLEDNFYLPSGEMASSNGDLVNAAAQMIELSGRSVADPSEARSLLSLSDPPDRTAYQESSGG